MTALNRGSAAIKGVGAGRRQLSAGYTVWFDELAYHSERIGCEL